MNDAILCKNYHLLCVIVNHGTAEKVMKLAKKNGITAGTILLGKGTIKNKILEFLEIADTRKEIILIGAEDTVIYPVAELISKEFEFHKPHHGISFIIPIASVMGVRGCSYQTEIEREGERKIMYNSIFTIVERGKAEEVIEAAQTAGSKGGTIINARGSGIHETQKLFHMDIEPEKEIVLILSEEHATDDIVEAIRKAMHIDEPGKGIMFVLNVAKTYGLY